MVESSEELFWNVSMQDEIEKLVVSSIIDDVLRTAPNGLLESYKSPSGRKPSPRLIEISKSISKLDREEVEEIIRDVVDYTLFATLYLIDANFKDARLSTKFLKGGAGQTDLVGHYRSLVDPGGKIASSNI